MKGKTHELDLHYEMHANYFFGIPELDNLSCQHIRIKYSLKERII